MNIDLTEKQTEYFDAVFSSEDNDFKVRTDNEYDEFFIVGGFGAAKSRIVSACTNLLCLKYPGSHGVYIRNTFPELKDSVIPQYTSNMPESENGYKFNISDRTAYYSNGTRLDFRAFDKDTKILSNEYDFIVFCQIDEIPEELFLAAIGRNRRTQGGMPKNIILAEGNPASGWLKTKLKDNPLPKNVYLLETRTADNPYLPKGYEAKLRATYPAFWIARYVDGEWNSIDEMVYSEFREKEHIVDPVNPQYIKHLKIRGGFDYGWRTDSAMNWAFVDYDGNVVIFDEWHAPQTPTNELARISRRHNYQSPGASGLSRVRFVADYAMKRPDRDGRSVWMELEKPGNDMLLSEAVKDEANAINLVNMMFKQGRLKITRNCVNTIRQISNWKWKKVKLGADKNAPEEPVDKDNHHCDCINYLISDLEGTASVSPKIEEYKKSLEYANIHGGRTVHYTGTGVS